MSPVHCCMVKSMRPSVTPATRACKRAEAQGPTWHVAMRRGKRRKLNEFIEPQFLAERAEKMKASIRAKVEHPFHMVKNLFGHKKARYKGMAKNTAQLLSLFGLANLVIARSALLDTRARGAS
jgi:IS5 family transposase